MVTTIHENLINYRKLSNLTKQEVAKLAKINYSTYNSYESGERVPGVAKLNALAEVLNVPLFYLLYDEPSRLKCHEFQEKTFAKDQDRFAFIKEDTHLVLKREDITSYLSLAERRTLDRIIGVIADERGKMGKEPSPKYLVCNKDENYQQNVLFAILAGELQKNK